MTMAELCCECGFFIQQFTSNVDKYTYFALAFENTTVQKNDKANSINIEQNKHFFTAQTDFESILNCKRKINKTMNEKTLKKTFKFHKVEQKKTCDRCLLFLQMNQFPF